MFRKYVKGFFARHRRNGILGRLDRYLVDLHRGYENGNYNFLENGEHFVLQTLKKQLRVQTVFDVGANRGEWSKIASRMFPDAQIYAFEILPETYKRLVENCRDFKMINPAPLGLADEDAEKEVYFSLNQDGKTTCVEDFFEKFHGARPQVARGTVWTGDRFCRQRGIDSLDFLKIDVEGFEGKVLKGFEKMLAARKVKIIQFEYGFINIAVRFFLRDFYEYLQSFSMQLGKIYPNYVDFRDYRFQDEDFLGPNYLAVHSSLGSLIESLKRGSS